MIDQLITKDVIFVGGKGGVGKTTSAAAIGYKLAEKGFKTLIISTDPAHSLGDVVDLPLSNDIQAIYENLSALELDSDVITELHFQNIERTMAKIANPSMLSKLKTHLELSKAAPGAQEAAILEQICKYLVEFKSMGFDKLVFDTAPTGHTLRLLILPELMTSWTDGLLAQQHKQEKLKQAAQSLWKNKEQPLIFNEEKSSSWHNALHSLENRKTLFKRSAEILHDKEKVSIVLVMVAEKLPLLETLRTLHSLEEAKMNCSGIIINQVIPENQGDSFWNDRVNIQRTIIDQLKNNPTASNLPRLLINLKPNNIIGKDELLKFL